MDFIKGSYEFLKRFFSSQEEKDKQLRKKLYIVLCVIVVLFGVMIYMYTRDDSELLLTTDDANVSANVITELKTRGVDYKVKGKSIYVTGTDVDELKLSLSGSGLFDTKTSNIDLFTKTLLISDSQEQNLNKTLLEDNIRDNIKCYKEVADARVSITLGEQSVFKDDSIPSKAGVVLSLRGKLSQNQILSIQSLIAASVPNLDKTDVVITDTDNNLLSGGDYVGIDEDNYAKNQESTIAKQIQGLLNGTFTDIDFKVVTRVIMDMDNRKIQKETVNSGPDTIVSRQTTIEGNGQNSASGVSGAETNIPSYQTSDSSKGSGDLKSSETVNYELNKTTEQIIKHPEIKRLSVAVIANKALTDSESAKIKELVSTAALIDVTRGDMISVQGFNVVKEKKEDKKLLSAENGLAVGGYIAGKLPFILIFILGIFVLRNLFKWLNKGKEEVEEAKKPAVINVPLESAVEIDDSEEMEDAQQTVRERIEKKLEKDPSHSASILKSWQKELEGR